MLNLSYMEMKELRIMLVYANFAREKEFNSQNNEMREMINKVNKAIEDFETLYPEVKRGF